MFKSSKKWIALLTSASMFFGTLTVCAAGTDNSDRVYDDSSVGISSAVEKYIEDKQNDTLSIASLTPVATDTDAIYISFEDGSETNGSADVADAADASEPAENKPQAVASDEKATEKVDEKTTEKTTEKKTEATTEKVASSSASVDASYDTFNGKAIVTTSSLNIRSKSDEKSDKVGTIAKGGLCTVKDKGKTWTLISSGKVTGYVKTEYLVFGKDAAKWAKSNGLDQVAIINVSGLRVRESADDSSKVISLAPKGEKYDVISVGKAWTKIEFDESLNGYVNNAYITISYKTKTAKAEAASTEATTEKKTEAATEKKTTEKTTEKATEKTTEKKTEETTAKKTEATTEKLTEGTAPIGNTQGSAKKQELVQYALQFVGNPYVYGGNSLTNGTDCSGFTMLIYKKYGVSLPHSAHLQANYGKEVPVSQAQPGDLLFYAKNGGINHVTIYIGNGQVVHASSPKAGIKISNYTYRQPVKCVRLID